MSVIAKRSARGRAVNHVFQVIEGGMTNCWSHTIAFSLVHPLQRIDIPVIALLGVEAGGQQAFVFEDGTSQTYDSPFVKICLAPDVREKLYRLTRIILHHDLDIKTLDVVIDDKSVLKPVIRETLGTQPCFQISASTLDEAMVLAEKLRARCGRADLRLI